MTITEGAILGASAVVLAAAGITTAIWVGRKVLLGIGLIAAGVYGIAVLGAAGAANTARWLRHRGTPG